MRRLVLFDVDGTLVDSGGAGRAALGRAMVRVFGEAGPIDTFDFHGRTDPSIVRGLLRAQGREDAWIDARMHEVWAPYLELLAEELAARNGRAHPYPGAAELLARLAERSGVTLGLVTGNLEEGARRKLAAAGVRAPFRVGGYGSDAERRDDLPPVALRRAAELGLRFQPADVWVVGDTPADIQCGRASGLRTLAVATGRHAAATLREHGAEVVVEDFSDVTGVAETLLS